jgi:uncharacterized protein (DUF1499 family)
MCKDKVKVGKIIDFDYLLLPSKPNYYLIYPKAGHRLSEHVLVGSRIAHAPIFNMPLIQLSQCFHAMMEAQARTTLIATDELLCQSAYIQRSLIFKFPDVIQVKLLALDNDRSSLYLFSYSLYGYYDFSVNKHRVEKYLKLIGSDNL